MLYEAKVYELAIPKADNSFYFNTPHPAIHPMIGITRNVFSIQYSVFFGMVYPSLPINCK